MVLLMMFAVIAAFCLSTILHMVLTGQMSVTKLSVPDAPVGIQLIRNDEKARSLFLIVVVLFWMGVALF